MENTPTMCANDLATIMGISKNDPTSRSVNNSRLQLDFDQNSIKDSFYQPKLRPNEDQPFMEVMAQILKDVLFLDQTHGRNVKARHFPRR